MENFSEEAVKVCNKLRRYREHVVRKVSFSLNMRDVFIPLMCNSDPVLNTFKKILNVDVLKQTLHIITF